MLAVLTNPELFAVAALILAIALSGWMAFRQRGAAGLPGCGAGSGCHAAANSRWSRFADLPVAILGAGIYLLTLLAWVCSSQMPAFNQTFMRMATAILAWLVVGGAVWFSILQLLVIHRLCSFCTFIHVLAVGAAIALLHTVAMSGVMGSVFGLPVLMSASFGLLLLIGGQILFRPKRYLLQSTPNTASGGDDTAATAPVDQSAVSPNPAHPSRESNNGRQITVLSGHVNLSTTDWPLLGPASAENVLVFLFDYTCSGCRHLHRLLDLAREQYGERLAIVEVPVPLSPLCNPGVKPRQASHPYACAYARLAVAVWKATPNQYETYVKWILATGEEPPRLGLARQEATRLTGTAIFDPSAPDPDVDPRLHAGLAIYHKLEVPNIPALLFPHGVLNGHVADLDELLQILNEPLGMRR